jgi:hypothetical protein
LKNARRRSCEEGKASGQKSQVGEIFSKTVAEPGGSSSSQTQSQPDVGASHRRSRRPARALSPSPPPAEKEEGDAEEGGGWKHKEGAEEGGDQQHEEGGGQQHEEGADEPQQQPELTEEEADWASLYEDPADYDEQRWIPVPMDQFEERNEGMKQPLPHKVWQRGPAGLPERPQKPYAVLIPKSDRYVF